MTTKSIPVTVQSGSATFKADLRLRVQVGAEATLPILGIGSGAVVGIYANIIEFVAVVNSTPDCALETMEWWDLNAGAYANLDVVIDSSTTLGLVPTVSTTLLTAPTLTQCWIEASATATGISNSSVVTYTSTSSSSTIQARYATPAPVSNYSSTPAEVSSSRYPFVNISIAATSPSASDDALVTSTIYSTAVYTLTSCAANVVNCPASYQKEVVVTQTVNAFTTVCPATAQITSLPEADSTIKVFAAPITTGDVVLLTPAATPIVNTFVPPTGTVAHVVGALATQKAAATTAQGTYPAGNSTALLNSAGAYKLPSAVIANANPSGISKSLSTQSPVTAAAAASPARPYTLLAAELFGASVILAWML